MSANTKAKLGRNTHVTFVQREWISTLQVGKYRSQEVEYTIRKNPLASQDIESKIYKDVNTANVELF